jgi:hypothetical protein
MGAHENIVAKDDMPSWTVLASASLLKPRGRNRPRWYVASKYEVIIVFNRTVSYFTIWCMYVCMYVCNLQGGQRVDYFGSQGEIAHAFSRFVAHGFSWLNGSRLVASEGSWLISQGLWTVRAFAILMKTRSQNSSRWYVAFSNEMILNKGVFMSVCM